MTCDHDKEASLNATPPRGGHPTEGVFMKCWRCQETRRLEHDGNGGLHCPTCVPYLWGNADSPGGSRAPSARVGRTSATTISVRSTCLSGVMLSATIGFVGHLPPSAPAIDPRDKTPPISPSRRLPACRYAPAHDRRTPPWRNTVSVRSGSVAASILHVLQTLSLLTVRMNVIRSSQRI